MRFFRRIFSRSVALFVVFSTIPAYGAADPLKIDIGFLHLEEEIRIPLSFLEPERADTGVGGAKLAVKDNNTTGKFTNQEYRLTVTSVPSPNGLVAAFQQLVAAGNRYIVANLPKESLLQIADLPEARDLLIFNIRAQDDSLRGQECRVNILHTALSRAMRADGLAQYLIWKRWQNWYLTHGPGEDDIAFADMVRRAAKRYGGNIVGEKIWTFDAGGRRTDSGHHSAQTEIPTFTQGPDYDVMIVADEGDQFGEYFSYRTHLPRPVAGTQGLIPISWHRSNEQWGATQFQNRFERLNNTQMTSRDYAAWMAVRTIGEAITRTQSLSPMKARTYALSAKFTLAAFKGGAVSYRPWNGQMRQPVLIAGERMLVSVSPQKGFLHQFSELDTLGYDEPETKCEFQ